MTNTLYGPIILGIAAWIAYIAAMGGSRAASWCQILPDHPNHRSSHGRITSKAGGFAIIGAWLAGMVIAAVYFSAVDFLRIGAGFAGLAILALGLGFADDKWTLSPALKLLGQFAVAVLFVLVFGSLNAAPTPFVGETALGAFGVGLTVFWIVAFMNTFNFMDGANGVAAGSACVGLSALAVIAAFSGSMVIAVSAILLAIACFGFLPSNLTRGDLFMGDNGSQAISFLIAAFAIFAANATEGRISALVIPVIFLPFIFDVTWTLAHRVLRKQNIFAAHREHNYQLLLRSGLSHTRVAVIYMTLIAFSSAGAIFMLTLAPSDQWFVPAALIGAHVIAAARLYARSSKKGLFDVAILCKDLNLLGFLIGKKARSCES